MTSPQTTAKIPFVDFARGFAIFTIVTMHLAWGLDLPGIVEKALSFGGAGVHMFILCSGFGLALSHLRRPAGYGAFLSRRLRRIYPPYFIAVALWCAYAFAKSNPIDWNAVASHVFLYKMFDAKLDVSICYHYWFVSTILQFYLCWPLILRLMRLRHGLPAAFAISIGWAALVGFLGLGESRPWGSCFVQYLWEFCLGTELAKNASSIEDRIRRLRVPHLALAAAACIAATGAMGVYGGFLKLFNDFTSLAGYTACALLAYKLCGRRACGLFEWTSGFGYEWYLLHGLVHMTVLSLLPRVPPLSAALLAFALSYGAGWTYRRALDQAFGRRPARKAA